VVEAGPGTAHLEEMLPGVGLMSIWRGREVVMWLSKGRGTINGGQHELFLLGRGGHDPKYGRCHGLYS
jgi:hypothetical protein